MDDMVDLVKANEHASMAGWLPILVEALREVGMSDQQFLLGASKENPQDVVSTLFALEDYNEDRAADRLLFLCAANQPAESVPIILALLRRKREDGTGVELAARLIEIFTGSRSSALPNTGPDHYVAVVSALRSATMEGDATRFLEGIGEYGGTDITLQVAASFPNTLSGDREKILRAAGKRGKWSLQYLFEALQKIDINGAERQIMLDRVIFGIPAGRNSEIALYLKSAGMHDEANRVLELENEPPF